MFGLWFKRVDKEDADLQSVTDFGELEKRFQACPDHEKAQVIRRYEELIQLATDLAELEKRFQTCPDCVRSQIVLRYGKLLQSIEDFSVLIVHYGSCPAELKYAILGEVRRLIPGTHPVSAS